MTKFHADLSITRPSIELVTELFVKSINCRRAVGDSQRGITKKPFVSHGLVWGLLETQGAVLVNISIHENRD